MHFILSPKNVTLGLLGTVFIYNVNQKFNLLDNVIRIIL